MIRGEEVPSAGISSLGATPAQIRPPVGCKDTREARLERLEISEPRGLGVGVPPREATAGDTPLLVGTRSESPKLFEGQGPTRVAVAVAPGRESPVQLVGKAGRPAPV